MAPAIRPTAPTGEAVETGEVAAAVESPAENDAVTLRHRGAHPEDRRSFSDKWLAPLQAAGEEVAWLLGRGYSMDSASRAVCDHHQLAQRQRLAVRRSSCSVAQRVTRREKELTAPAARSVVWSIDGFNLIITLEVALSGGLLLRGMDGTLRDLLGLRGSYHPVVETSSALSLLGSAIANLRPAEVRIFLDAPVANSGRLAALIREQAAMWQTPLVVELVANVDRVLVGKPAVISSDSVVLDRCASWFNLAAQLVRDGVPDAWILDLSAPSLD